MIGQGNASSLDSIWRLRGACSSNDSGILVEPNTYPVENAVCPANLDSTDRKSVSNAIVLRETALFASQFDPFDVGVIDGFSRSPRCGDGIAQRRLARQFDDAGQGKLHRFGFVRGNCFV
jgi:hypothetical protein